MDDGLSALRKRPGPPAPPGFTRPSLRSRSVEPHHRRRRALALTALGLLLLMVILALSLGGGVAGHHVASRSPGYFARIQTLAGTGPGSFVLAERNAENEAIDRTLAEMPYVRVAGAQHREMALTFDDGPGPYTPEILSVLERQKVPGTFFEVGILEKYFHASTSRIVSDGFPIGDHTESHAPMARLSSSGQQSQLLTQTSLVGAYGASFPRMFRPPYGLWNSSTLALLRKYRMLMVLWTIDTNDYRRPGVSTIVNTVLSGARPGAIVLLHDGGGDRTETVAALPRIIKRLRARGYKLVSVPKLLVDNPPPQNQQISSLSGSGG